MLSNLQLQIIHSLKSDYNLLYLFGMMDESHLHIISLHCWIALLDSLLVTVVRLINCMQE